MSSQELLMVVGGSAVAAWAYSKWGFGKSKATRDTVALVLLSAGVAFAVYQYSSADAGSAALVGAVTGPAVDAATAVSEMVAAA